MYGREKIGKTTFFASYPDALFLSTEPGTKGQRIFEYNAEDGGCKNWKLIRAAVDQLEKTDRFKAVVFDTVDRAYDMCLDYVCEERNIEYPGQDEYGQEDFGKSWRAVKQEFLGIVHRILQTGRGVCFTSHAKETLVRSKSGDRYTRIFPSMGNQARAVVEALVDLFFYADYMRATDGTVQRVLITEGDEMIWAGSREIDHELPRLIPLTKKGGFDILQSAFKGEDVGLDPATLMPTRTASEAVRKFYQRIRADAVKNKTSKPATKERRAKGSKKTAKRKV